MKVKEGFILKRLSGVNAIVAVGGAVEGFNATVTINDTGAFMFDCLQEGLGIEGTAKKVVEEYEVEYEKALTDVQSFAEGLLDAGVCEEG